MGYGGSSKGGGGSGSAGGGKKKSGRGGKPKARNLKVKQKATAASPPPQSPAFTVREPDPENRARLLAARQRGERAANARKEALRTPVSGTGPRGRLLGSASEAVGDDATTSAASGDHPHQQQPQQNTVPAEREARLAFLAAQEANAEAARRERSQAERARREAASRRRCGPCAARARRHLDALAARLGGREESEEARRLLEVVLRNAATKADAKYRALRAANDGLWTRVLRFLEAVALLEEAGFERRNGAERRRVAAVAAEEEAAAAEIRRERERLQRRLSQALDADAAPSTKPHAPGAVAALLADFEALDVAPLEERPGPVAVEEARDFELWHAGAGADGLGLERVLAVLHTVHTW